MKYEDPRGGYVVELPTEGVISTAFDYDRDTIQDVFEKLIKRKNMGTSDTHYLKTVGGRILQNNSSTLISVNKGKPFDTLEEPVKMRFGFVEDPYGIPELYFELCPRYGPLAHELSYFAYPAVCSSSSSAHESPTSALKNVTSALKKIVTDPGLMTANSSF